MAIERGRLLTGDTLGQTTPGGGNPPLTPWTLLLPE